MKKLKCLKIVHEILSPMKTFFVVPLLCLILIFLSSKATAQTNVSGSISSNTTWTLQGSPYIVTGNILVSSGAALTIEPGVVVAFSGGWILQIDGALVARGTILNKIKFTSNKSNPMPGDWGYIFFTNSSIDANFDQNGNYISGSALEHCELEYGGSITSPSANIRIDQSSPFISSSTIRLSKGRGIYAYKSNSRINNNIISNNSGGGIQAIDSNLIIRKNIVMNNSSSLGGAGIRIFGSDNSEISGNLILNNTLSGVDSGGGILFYGQGKISNNIIANNQVPSGDSGGIFIQSGLVSVTNNAIIRNSANSNGALRSHLANNPIKNNLITENRSNTSTIGEGQAAVSLRTYPEFTENNIFNNQGVYEAATVNSNTSYPNPVNSKNNWWGTAIEADIQAKIYDSSKKSTLGTIDFRPWAFNIRIDTPVSPPKGLSGSAAFKSIILSWSANPESNVAGYKIYWGSSPGFPYTNVVDVGNRTGYTITGLTEGTYYVSVTAYNTNAASVEDDPNTIINERQIAGFESWFAEGIMITVVPAISIALSGAGQGTVTSNVGGISCGIGGIDCFKYYSLGARIILTATPVAGSTFVKWTDDCAPCGSAQSCEILADKAKVCSATFSSDVQPAITWMRTYGGAKHDEPSVVRQTPDGGYIMAGNSASFGDSGNKVWVLKVDVKGIIQWQKVYENTNNESYTVNSLVRTNDGGYILAGSAQTCYENEGPLCIAYGWLLKLDAHGQVIWQKGYKDNLGYGAEFFAIQQTTDSGYIAAGRGGTLGTVNPYSKLWVVKIDAAGNMLWNRMFDYDGHLADS